MSAPRLPTIWVREHPLAMSELRPMREQEWNQGWIEGNLLFGVPRLHFACLADHPSSLHENSIALEIEVAPLQPENFTDPKSKAHRNHDHGAPRLIDVTEQLPALFNREDSCFSLRTEPRAT